MDTFTHCYVRDHTVNGGRPLSFHLGRQGCRDSSLSVVGGQPFLSVLANKSPKQLGGIFASGDMSVSRQWQIR
jgi:hypothetical protein